MLSNKAKQLIDAFQVAAHNTGGAAVSGCDAEYWDACAEEIKSLTDLVVYIKSLEKTNICPN